MFLSDIGSDRQNKATLGRQLATGSIAETTDEPVGRIHTKIRFRHDELRYDPSILVMRVRHRSDQRGLEHGGRKEVRTMESVTTRSHPDVWETPEFEEIGVAAEVTMYVARLED